MQRTETAPFTVNAVTTKPIDLSKPTKIEFFTPHSRLLKSLSAVVAGSTWCSQDADVKSKPFSADHFCMDISVTGLPIAAVFDGCSRHAEPAEVKAIADHVMAMLARLATYAQGKALSADDIKAEVKREYEALDTALQHQFGSDVVFSAAALYEDNQGKMKVLSFGTGDTMIVLDNRLSMRSLIAAVNTSLGRPIPFPSTNMKGGNLDAALTYLQVNIDDVNADDRLIFMTDGAHNHLDLQADDSLDEKVKYHRFHDKTCVNRVGIASIATDAIRAIKSARESSHDDHATFGDDFTIAEVQVPDRAYQNKLAFFVALHAYIAKRTTEAAAQGKALLDSYLSIFGQVVGDGLNGDVKVGAANQMIAALNAGPDDYRVTFTEKAVKALRNSSSVSRNEQTNPGLGHIVAKYEKLGCLPTDFLVFEQQYKKQEHKEAEPLGYKLN